MTTLETKSHKDVLSVIWFLCAKHVSTIKIHRPVTEVYGQGIMSVIISEKWCREFENG
jgi:hypothetical protein